MQRVVFTEPSSLGGSIQAPSSKSHSHRLLFFALISNIPIRIQKLLGAKDVGYTIETCKQLGMEIEVIASDYEGQFKWVKCFPPNKLKSNDLVFDCGNSGTTVRFLIGLSLAIQGKIHITGEFFERNRPYIPMLEAMERIGTQFSENNDGITVETPHINKSILFIPGNFSSQFISGLIFGVIGLYLRPTNAKNKNFNFKKFIIETTTPQVSYPYIALTHELITRFGIELYIKQLSNGCIRITMPLMKTPLIVQSDFEIPIDYSALAPLLCGTTLFGRNDGLRLMENTESDLMLNYEIVKILSKVGLNRMIEGESLRFYSTRHSFSSPKDLIINCKDIPDLFPSLCVLGAYLPGKTILTHLNHLKYKESNRVEVMVNILREFNVHIELINDLVKIVGSPTKILHKSHTFSGIKDHRILMALIIFSLGVKYNGYQLTIENVEHIADSYPMFIHDLHYQLGVKFHIDEEEVKSLN